MEGNLAGLDAHLDPVAVYSALDNSSHRRWLIWRIFDAAAPFSAWITFPRLEVGNARNIFQARWDNCLEALRQSGDSLAWAIARPAPAALSR